MMDWCWTCPLQHCHPEHYYHYLDWYHLKGEDLSPATLTRLLDPLRRVYLGPLLPCRYGALLLRL
jgi:hypothetical protein